MSKLIIIPTPIGNLEDITLRGLRMLGEVDLILAEDTRTSKKLLNHYNIETPCESFHMFNEHKKLAAVIRRLEGGTTIALISDAGTPGISDPGYLLIRAALEQNIPVECLPGATALIPALVQSGLPSDRFVFEGFLPPKKGRQKRLEQLATEPRTVILYESPHKLVKTLSQLVAVFGPDRNIVVLRELTKLHETSYSLTLQSALVHFEKQPPKGELVLCLAGFKP
ncbi:MAG: 16S rRNA (cytidine(1402)-2'-O)-methyltransferase [Flavobacteriaceae bacterium]|jgi:16S rRNA (cytidine1402-2'-O)-methyltransferase